MTITLLGPASPASAGGVDELVADCPSGSEVAALRADLFVEVVDDPTAADGFVCRAADGSADLTRLEERVIQALRVMQRVEFTRELPWTNQQLYAWLTDSIGGIRATGPDPAPGVFAIHEPEAGLEFQTVSFTKGACVRRGGGSEEIRCELGELSVGETVRITTSHRVGAQPGTVLRGDGFAAISPAPDRGSPNGPAG